ncbi:MAG: DMT family transporter [Victivallales bacterium]|nr:DMT family transporter [Victivallales bacterium]
MLTGILYGLAAAFMQSSSYIFSRNFVVKFANPVHLMIYSQIVMGALSVLVLPLAMPEGLFETREYALPIVLCAAAYLLGQGSFFMTLRELEASRASSLLGVKLVVLALINLVVFGIGINALQWLAVFICVIAAIMMNFSGVRMSFKAMIWLLMTCVGYSFSDIFGREAVLLIPSDSLFQQAVTSTALCYMLLGALSLPGLWFIKRSKRAFICAVPFGVCWFLAMLVLFSCFASIGVVFGNIVQASRGLMSVLLGITLARAGYSHIEMKTSAGTFWKRIFAALLMIAAIALYSYSRL